MGEQVLFVVGILSDPKFDFSSLSPELTGKYGKIAFSSQSYPFDFSDYYAREMGKNLSRKWLVFSELFSAEQIVERKKYCLRLEKKYSTSSGLRRVNIDPGYLAGAKFVLSSRKNNAHRIYLGDEVFSELTLIYRDNGWRELRWTYPEFRETKHKKWLKKARRLWLDKRN